MKYLFAIALFASLMSCTSQEEKVISEYVQNIGGIKTDLSFKVIEIDTGVVVTGSDSLKIIKESLEAKRISEIKRIEEKTIEDSIAAVKRVEYAKSLGLTTHEPSDFVVELNEGARAIQEKYISDLKDPDSLLVQFPLHANAIMKYEGMKDSILAIKYKCTYQIKNPIFNAKQEVTKVFVLAPDKSAVIRDEGI